MITLTSRMSTYTQKIIIQSFFIRFLDENSAIFSCVTLLYSKEAVQKSFVTDPYYFLKEIPSTSNLTLGESGYIYYIIAYIALWFTDVGKISVGFIIQGNLLPNIFTYNLIFHSLQ